MRIVSTEHLNKNCPECSTRGRVSKLKKVVQEWHPFTDSGNNSYEIHVTLCACGYALVTKDTLESYRKVPYRMNVHQIFTSSD